MVTDHNPFGSELRMGTEMSTPKTCSEINAEVSWDGRNVDIFSHGRLLLQKFEICNRRSVGLSDNWPAFICEQEIKRKGQLDTEVHLQEQPCVKPETKSFLLFLVKLSENDKGFISPPKTTLNDVDGCDACLWQIINWHVFVLSDPFCHCIILQNTELINPVTAVWHHEAGVWSSVCWILSWSLAI